MSTYARAARRISTVLGAARYAARCAPPPGPAWFESFIRSVGICTKHRYEPVEAFRLGFFSPAFDKALLRKCISRKMLTRIQKKYNPPQWAELARNKGLFHRWCGDSGIKTPALYLLSYDANLWSDCSNGGVISCDREKSSFVHEKLPDRFVIKPLRSAYGKGVCIFTKDDGQFKDTDGSAVTARQLVAHLHGGYPDGFLIQQRIDNHPDIDSLSGCEALQTVRVITFIDASGRINLLHAHFKPITRPGVVIDTHLDGLTGNVEVPVDINSGILSEANQIAGDGSGIATIIEHPITGRPFKGFALPRWQDVRRAAAEAAVKMLPLRLLGWDIAISPDGPVIIEANVWWDPPNQHLVMDRILEELAENQA
jgi:hypothetical protein